MAQEIGELPPPGSAAESEASGAREYPGEGRSNGTCGGDLAPEPPEKAAERCPQHALELGWFCCTERRPVCAQCLSRGGCQGHRVRPIQEAAADVRNKIVDQCEKLQLQSAAITKYVEEVLPRKNVASCAREVLIQRLIFVRNVCENEEQQLLEKAHAEEERANQSILTQRAHWTEALQKLATLRTYLVGIITNMDDCDLVVSIQKECLTEEAEGILEPQESEKLNFNQKCVHSPLLSRLWASAILCCSEDIHINERTIGPLLALSEDKKTLTFIPKKAKGYPDDPERFDGWPNALARESFQKGVHAWRINVEKSNAYKLGISYSSLQRKGLGDEDRLGYNPVSWVFSCFDKKFSFSHNSHHQSVELLKCPTQIGVLVDFEGGELLFYDPNSCVILHLHREIFIAPVYPVLAVADQSVSLVQ
uniref:B-box and SPRY domain containing n=1 Tax=Sphenodon punctatus TaxID=8508 RepID=A0A8D0HGG3_SPHPU